MVPKISCYAAGDIWLYLFFQAPKLAQELSDLIHYCQAVSFKGFNYAKEHCKYHGISQPLLDKFGQSQSQLVQSTATCVAKCSHQFFFKFLRSISYLLMWLLNFKNFISHHFFHKFLSGRVFTTFT